MKKTALQSKRVGVLQMAFLTRKLFGTFEKRAPGPALLKAWLALTSVNCHENLQVSIVLNQ